MNTKYKMSDNDNIVYWYNQFRDEFDGLFKKIHMKLRVDVIANFEQDGHLCEMASECARNALSKLTFAIEAPEAGLKLFAFSGSPDTFLSGDVLEADSGIDFEKVLLTSISDGHLCDMSNNDIAEILEGYADKVRGLDEA